MPPRSVLSTHRQMVTNEVDQFELVDQDPTNIVVSSRSYLTRRNMNYTKSVLHVGAENVANFYTAMLLPKRSPLTRPFNIMFVFKIVLEFTMY